MDKASLCNIVQESLRWCEGAPNFAGMQGTILYTAVSNIISWPERKKTLNGAELAEYKENSSFVLKADKKFLKIDILPSKSTSKSDPQGELPSSSQLNKISAVHPGTGVDASNAAAYINNVPCVFLVKDMDGNWRVCGCERWCHEIKATVASDWGQGSAGSAQTTIEIEAPDTTPFPVYHGELEIDGVDIDQD